jgi:hypothetical protein
LLLGTETFFASSVNFLFSTLPPSTLPLPSSLLSEFFAADLVHFILKP